MDGPPDVEIAASVRATEMRFECKPEVSVVVWAGSPASVVHESERENLPDEVECGVTYHNVAARWRVGARLDDPAMAAVTEYEREAQRDETPVRPAVS